MARLEELTDYPALIAQGSLGSLLTSGTLERFVKHQRTDLERKAQALEWLEQMRGERPEAAGE
jgi:hypothetical protein